MEDYLRECMQDMALAKKSIPIDEFNTHYCLQCINPSCSRSRMIGMSTYVRAQNWKRDLFDNVPRAKDNDKSYDIIRSKKFISPNMNSGVEIETKIDEVKNESNEIKVEVKFLGQDDKENIITEKAVDLDSGIKPVEPTQVKEENEAPVKKETVDTQKYANTAFKQGTMLGGGVIKPPSDVVMQPGSTFTFGDDE